jgi:hypothetical protein
LAAPYGFFLDVARNDFAEVLGIDLTDEGVKHTREQLNLPADSGRFLAA